MLLDPGSGGLERDAGSEVDRIAIVGRDRREGDRAGAVASGEVQRRRYALASSSASPAPPPRQTGPTAWTTISREIARIADHGTAGGAVTIQSVSTHEIGHHGRPTGPVDRAIDPATPARALFAAFTMASTRPA